MTKIKVCVDDDKQVYSIDKAYEIIKREYWDDLCEDFIRNCSSTELIEDLFFGGTNYTHDMFDVEITEKIDEMLCEEFYISEIEV